MTDTKHFLVTADHVVAKHACVNLEVVCRSYDTGTGQVLWYAIAPGYGCSKNYRTAETAIREMLTDHACTNIRIVAV